MYLFFGDGLSCLGVCFMRQLRGGRWVLEGPRAPVALAVSWNSVKIAGTSLSFDASVASGPWAPCILFFSGEDSSKSVVLSASSS